MQYILENTQIRINICSKGAELQSIQKGGIEFLYQKKAGFWQRQSPVLFPIVGALRGGKYLHENQEYILPQHGFARDMEWSLIDQNTNSLTFVLQDSESTRLQYPFAFRLEMTYQLLENGFLIEYFLENPSTDHILPASIGAHPAFHFDGDISEYSLHFGDETELRAVYLDHGLLSEKKEQFELHEGILSLSESLFAHDALIFQELESSCVRLYRGSEPVWTLDRENFPFLALWKQPDAPFLCIEPWAGYADPVGNSPLTLTDKPAVLHLAPLESVSYTWSLTF